MAQNGNNAQDVITDYYVKCRRCRNIHKKSERYYGEEDRYGLRTLKCPRCNGHDYTVVEKPENSAQANALGVAKVRLQQKYDGNKYNSRSYTVGHLFKEESNALCGFRFNAKSAPVIENKHTAKLCKKCHRIATKQGLDEV